MRWNSSPVNSTSLRSTRIMGLRELSVWAPANDAGHRSKAGSDPEATAHLQTIGIDGMPVNRNDRQLVSYSRIEAVSGVGTAPLLPGRPVPAVRPRSPPTATAGRLRRQEAVAGRGEAGHHRCTGRRILSHCQNQDTPRNPPSLPARQDRVAAPGLRIEALVVEVEARGVALALPLVAPPQPGEPVDPLADCSGS